MLPRLLCHAATVLLCCPPCPWATIGACRWTCSMMLSRWRCRTKDRQQSIIVQSIAQINWYLGVSLPGDVYPLHQATVGLQASSRHAGVLEASKKWRLVNVRASKDQACCNTLYGANVCLFLCSASGHQHISLCPLLRVCRMNCIAYDMGLVGSLSLEGSTKGIITHFLLVCNRRSFVSF